MLIIASALSVQDPRDRPIEAQEQADQAHDEVRRRALRIPAVTLKIWNWFEEAIAHKKSNRQLHGRRAARTSCRSCACANGATCIRNC